MDTQMLSHPDRRKAERRRNEVDAEPDPQEHEHSAHTASYGRFWAMVATATVIGWAAMYLNTYQLDHLFFSWIRAFMAMIMGGVMVAVMMVFMWPMYPNKPANLAVLGVGGALILAGFVLVQLQLTVGDVAYMRAMIPHHSIAILTSSRARIEDPRVRALADNIIESQTREIAEMKQLVDELDR